MRPRLSLIALAFSALSLAACDAHAPAPTSIGIEQAQACAVPADLSPARPYRVPTEDIVSNVPTAYHLLAVSWSPQACRSGNDYPDADHQCRDNQFGLTLHGLWPNGAPGTRYPRYCRPELAAMPVPARTVRQHFCMTPSPELQQHEWAAHGTCGWTKPEDYFADAARLWNGLNRPDLEAIPADRLTAGAIRRAFAQANPGLDERSVIVSISEGWFREVRLCYDLNYRPVACPIPLGPSDDTRIRLAPRGPATPR